MPFWSKNVAQIGTLNPYNKVEAETIAFSEGLKTERVTEWERNNPYNRGKKIADRIYISSINNGDYIKVQGADFSKGLSSIDVSIASLYGGKIEVHTDKIDGPVIATVNVTTSGEGEIWKTFSAPVKNVKGIHDLFFVFKGDKDLLYFDWWQFK